MLAFSTGADIGLPRMVADEHALFNTMQSLGYHPIEAAYEAAVDSVEEAILNALVAAETTLLIKPSGKVWTTMNHNRPKELLKTYNRKCRTSEGREPLPTVIMSHVRCAVTSSTTLLLPNHFWNIRCQVDDTGKIFKESYSFARCTNSSQ